MNMFETREQIKLGGVMALARQGNSEAQKYLKEKFSLKIYTEAEINRVNQLRFENGLTIQQAIQQLKLEEAV